MMLVAGTTAYPLFGDTLVGGGTGRAAREQWQRTLTIDGGIELSLWPELGFRVGKARLSESGGDGRSRPSRAPGCPLHPGRC
ncbi:MAG: hypothetical protein IPJ52_09910 [Rhodocyclaceae bacterium]|nr:hypothetical protein [Rhodocyclaceae bacterium]